VLTVHKFKLDLYGNDRVEIPEGAKVIHAGMQGKDICIWAIVDTESPMEKRWFWIAGTGHPLPRAKNGKVEHIRTIQDVRPDREYVWHIFELEEVGT
jgi:hypothetical protein